MCASSGFAQRGASRFRGAGQLEDAVALGRVDHRDEEIDRAVAAIGPKLRHRPRETARLRERKVAREPGAALRRVELAMAAVRFAGARLDEALRDQLLEDAVEALLGDAQDFEQLGDGQSGLPTNKMQHPVMRASEAEGFEQAVRVADEVAVGEVEKFDQVEHRRFVRARIGAFCIKRAIPHDLPH